MNDIKVILDSKEASTNKSLKRLIENIDGIIFEVKQLGVGDLLIGKYLIERKSVKDILTRYKDGSLHIFDQLDRLKIKESEGFIPIILVDGLYFNAWNKKPHNKQNQIRSQISGLENKIRFDKRYEFQVIKYDDERQVFNWIKNLINRAQNPNKQQLRSLRTTPQRIMSDDDKSLYILQGYKFIGPTKTKRLLNEFGSIDNIHYDLHYAHGSILEENKERFIKFAGKKALEEFLRVNKHNYEEK